MEIKYMKNLEKIWRQKKKLGYYGVDEKVISDFEKEKQISFPKAYREFLLLTGNSFEPFKMDHEFDYAIEKSDFEYFPEALKEYGIDLKKKFWVYAHIGGTTIFFFYFDEGDNPPTYVCEVEFKEENPNYLRKIRDSFSDAIDFHLRKIS